MLRQRFERRMRQCGAFDLRISTRVVDGKGTSLILAASIISDVPFSPLVFLLLEPIAYQVEREPIDIVIG
jgi:hypothetical protein